MNLKDTLATASELRRGGKHAEAVRHLRAALGDNPGNFRLLQALGLTCGEAGQRSEAVDYLTRAITADPRAASAHFNLGNALFALRRYEEAIDSYCRARDLMPDHADTYHALGTAQASVGRFADATASIGRFVAMRPRVVEAHHTLGNLFYALGRFEEAAGRYQRAIALKPDHAETLYCLGTAQAALGQNDAAIGNYQRALDLKPDFALARANLVSELIAACDWTRSEPGIAELIGPGGTIGDHIRPALFLRATGDPSVQRRAGEAYARQHLEHIQGRVRQRASTDDERIRIAYVSSRLRDHRDGSPIAALAEAHNHERFDIVTVALGGDDGGETRRRLQRACDSFEDVGGLGDRAAAEMIADHGIHIAVDLDGYAGITRTAIFAHRPAPLQVSYLGFPATMGASFMDYVLVDRFVAPADQQANFTERLVQLPDCCRPGGDDGMAAAAAPARADAGLPDDGFVFCSFAGSDRITPDVFEVWMRLLAAVPGSVLWLAGDNGAAIANLRAAAGAQDVDGARLVFAPQAGRAEHLARLGLGDLFLDTLPCNAYESAGDALRCGLPVVTCAGRTFSGRIGSSLARAAGLAELAVDSLADYEALALRLARESDLLAGLRGRLSANRDSAPLFDIARHCRGVEAAYATMFETWRAGAAPRGFAVEVR